MARPEPVGASAMAGCRVFLLAAAAFALAVYLVSMEWGWSIYAGVPGISARAITSAIVADIKTSHANEIPVMLQNWGSANPSALGLALLDESNVAIEAYPPELRGARWDPALEPVEQIARARRMDVAPGQFAVQERSFTGPDGVRVYRVIVVVPDVAVLTWWKAPFSMLLLANPILVTGYWVLVATFVYVDALLRKPRRVALRWSLFAVGFNLIALAVYLAVGRKGSGNGI